MQKSSLLRHVGLGVAGIAVAAVLASCGGGGGGSDNGTPPTSTAPSNTPPASASASSDGFIAFLKVYAATPQDMAMPLDVTAFVAPMSDTTLPDMSF